MSAARARLMKIAVLLTPLIMLTLFLKVYGSPVRQFFRDLLTSTQFQTIETDEFIFVLESRSDYHQWAEDRLHHFVEMMSREPYNFPVPGDPPVTVYLVETEEDLRRFGPIADHPDPTANGGYFHPRKNEIAALIHRHLESDQRILLHEMTHILMARGNPDAEWSPWISEGFAITMSMSGQKELGAVSSASAREVTASLQAGRFIQLSELLSVRDPTNYEREARQLFYREAHLLVAFLMEKHPRKFTAYFREEQAAGPMPDGAFVRHFGRIADIETTWKQFVESKVK